MSAQTAGGSTQAPDPRASEEMRHLTQERLALLGLVTLCLSGGYLVVSISAEAVLYDVDRALTHLLSAGGVLNGAGALVSGVVWLVARTGNRGPTQLLVIDGVGTIAAVVPYTLMSVLCLEKDPPDRPQSALELGELLDACDDVGLWTTKDARGWWATHGSAVRAGQSRQEISATGRTVAVDIENR